MFAKLFGRPQPHANEAKKPRLPEGVRVYAVGDIHGRSDLLDLIHEAIVSDWAASPLREGHIVCIGDYVDRGTDSAGVLERISHDPPAGLARTLLKGNHEEMLETFLEDPKAGSAWRQLGGLATIQSYRIDVNSVLQSDGFAGLSVKLRDVMPQHHRRLLADLRASLSIGDYFFCHAGVKPGILLEEQKPRDLLWVRDEFLSSTADFGRMVVHGHSPVGQPEFRANRINIDTGAYFSGHLTCLVLEGEQHRIIST